VQFSLLGSGSRGNGTLVRSNTTCVLLDCGFSVKDAEARLQRLGVEPREIDAIIVTHEHSDHIKGVGGFSRKFKTPVYMTKGTYRARDYGQITALHEVVPNESFCIGDLEVLPVPVSHDANQPVQYVLSHQQSHKKLRLGVLTDLGTITQHVEQMYSSCDALIVECNHDLDMLAMGSYSYSLKQRVGGHLGHLNNIQTANFLRRINLGQWQHLVAAHISEKNNTLDLVKKALLDGLGKMEQLVIASQDEGLDWLKIE